MQAYSGDQNAMQLIRKICLLKIVHVFVRQAPYVPCNKHGRLDQGPSILTGVDMTSVEEECKQTQRGMLGMPDLISETCAVLRFVSGQLASSIATRDMGLRQKTQWAPAPEAMILSEQVQV